MKLSFHHQAQSRVLESSQKMDLLRVSLERRLKEMSQEHLQEPVIKEDLSMGSSPCEGQKQNRLLSFLSTPSSTSFIKPACLTGIYSFPALNKTYLYTRFHWFGDSLSGTKSCFLEM